MNENIRTEEENRKIGWYFVIFSGKERPAYFDGKNWIVWGNMGFWNDSDLSKISDRLIPYFHTQQLEKDNWVSVSEHGLPTDIGTFYVAKKFEETVSEMEYPSSKFTLEFNKEWWLKYITHYQKKIVPNPPLHK